MPKLNKMKFLKGIRGYQVYISQISLQKTKKATYPKGDSTILKYSSEEYKYHPTKKYQIE
jgi:hypothetical protein